MIVVISFIASLMLSTYLLQAPSARAVMYKQTAQSEGIVFWTSPLRTIEAGRQKENLVEAWASIPTIGKFDLSLFPNTRRGEPTFDADKRLLRCQAGERDFCGYLPATIEASHLLDLRIEFAESFRHGIVSIPEILLKQARDDPGFPLQVNTAFGPSDADFAAMRASGKYKFVYGLLDDANAERENLSYIQEVPFIEIAIPFADGSRGYVDIYKGSYGQRIVRETLQKWGTRYQN